MFGDKINIKESITVKLQCAQCGQYVANGEEHVCLINKEKKEWQEKQERKEPQS
jgi:hypothetical protein